jgi:hypothetical protein
MARLKTNFFARDIRDFRDIPRCPSARFACSGPFDAAAPSDGSLNGRNFAGRFMTLE